jgi:hypothetical protein
LEVEVAVLHIQCHPVVMVVLAVVVVARLESQLAALV